MVEFEPFGMGQVRLARLADLLKDDVMVGAVESAPGGNVALEAAQLARGVALKIALGEDAKERFGLERRVRLELLFDGGPVGEKGIGARAVVTRLAERTGQSSCAQVFAGVGQDNAVILCYDLGCTHFASVRRTCTTSREAVSRDRRYAMAHIAIETTMMAPIGTVFDLLRTPTRRPEWMTNLHEVRNVTGHDLNDSWEYTYTMLGRPFTGKIFIRELEIPHYLKLEVGGGIEGTQEWRLTSRPDGTTFLRFTFDYAVPVLLGGVIADKLFIERQNERQMRTALENLKTMVEHAHEKLAREHGA